MYVKVCRIKLDVALDTVIYGVQLPYSETILKVESGFFPPYFGKTTRPPESGSFCVLFKIGKNSQCIIQSDKTRNQISGSLISIFQHLE